MLRPQRAPTNAMANARIKVPDHLKKGQIFEVRVLIRHPMETAFRYNNVGQKIPENIVRSVSCWYNGRLIFEATLHPGIAANPYFSFFTTAVISGPIELKWTDSQGVTSSNKANVIVTD